ncbi:hypothetical protein EVAR_29152_1 [Eumeta japonica]|uniref:Uncharacterized protein n=1 Tax=Eumeta variegata TaxID=151549 RepID=A0A4C1VBM2_EUMVA|nr:hypothetical protein EVAR_29152_1 [Eumeta japonica]
MGDLETLSVSIANTECNEIGYFTARVAPLVSENPAELNSAPLLMLKAGVLRPPPPLEVVPAPRPNSVAVIEVRGILWRKYRAPGGPNCAPLSRGPRRFIPRTSVTGTPARGMRHPAVLPRNTHHLPCPPNKSTLKQRKKWCDVFSQNLHSCSLSPSRV